jgi:hypothetical protein
MDDTEARFEGDPMKRLIFGVGAIILSLAYFAEPGVAQEAGELEGNWVLTMEPPPGGGGGGGGRGGGGGGRGGGFGGPQTLMLYAQGEMLEGTLESQAGSIELSNVMLEGTEISFTVERETPRGVFELVYMGEIDGNTMSGTMEGPGGRFTVNWTATRET